MDSLMPPSALVRFCGPAHNATAASPTPQSGATSPMSASVRRFVLPVALVVLFAAPAAAQNWPVPFGPARSPADYRYDPAAWKAVPPDYLDDAPACILYSRSEYRL